MNSYDLDHYTWRNNPSNPTKQIEYVLLMGSKLDPKTKAFVASSHYLQYDVSVVEIRTSEGGGAEIKLVSVYME